MIGATLKDRINIWFPDSNSLLLAQKGQISPPAVSLSYCKKRHSIPKFDKLINSEIYTALI